MKSIKRMPPRPPPKTPISRSNSGHSFKLPVQVYCRLRPMLSDSDLSCVRVVSPKSVILTPPEIAINFKCGNLKETEYIFEHVFDTKSVQCEVFTAVAQPLVENLIRGKNGLLFTYGVTGSGKTFTMTGDTQHRGIMPRCFDILFKTISDYQTKKCVFKPDRLNGFEILGEADALLERQAEMTSRFAKIRRKDSDPEIASQASADVTRVDGIDEDNMYSVFISYIEVYNNSVYDLLEEGNQKTLQTKIIREDAQHNMYVHGVTEVEVKSVQDAIDAFQIGQKRKRMGHTILNAESSRSHSVFTLRLIQAPTDSKGEYVMQDKRTITISQLSLVDLAGSERTNRTKNTGQRLREAGNINNSLMTLRTCLEVLRENHTTNSAKKVPYRDSKITHFFKNFFEGEGHVRMVVCINPRAEDYDESAQVMKFAEMTQEVQTARPTPRILDAALTPGRRKANQMYKIAVHTIDSQLRELPTPREIEKTPSSLKITELADIDYDLVYNFGPIPEYKMNNPEDEASLMDLIEYMKQRIEKKKKIIIDYNARQDHFRMQLVEWEKEAISMRAENLSLKAIVNQERQRTQMLENKVSVYESSVDDMNRKLKSRDDQIKELQRKLNEKQILLGQTEMEKEKQKKKFTSKIAVETVKMNRELEIKLREQKNKLHEKMRVKDEKLRLVSNILKVDKFNDLPTLDIDQENAPSAPPCESSISVAPFRTPRPAKGPPVANIRHRRSRSAGDRWLEHRAPVPVPLNTILQPYLKNRKSVTKLTDVRDITNNRTSKYCLISQEADTDGEVETKLYKGDVIPTTGGGAQIVFNDVECLKQMSPLKSPSRKRPSAPQTENGTMETPSRCSISIEGHSKKTRV